MRLRVGAATDTGRVRDLNEDAHMVSAEQGLFVVCDGMGGCPAGEVASQMAVETILERLNGTAEETATFPAEDRGYLSQTSRLADAVRRSNRFIYNQAQKDSSRTEMGTTIVGAWIAQNIASVAHVGDSRAYLWHNDQLEPLTRDHSLVEAQVRAGLLDREKSLQSDQQNVLLRVLGRAPEVEVELSEVPVQPGDYLLLCSDGLTRMVPEPTLACAIFQLRDPQRICDYLVATANHNGGADDITVVVVEVIDGGWRRLRNHWRRSFWGGAMPQLVLQFEGLVLKECSVGLMVTIGRLPDNTVVIDNPAVSSHHACVFRAGDDYILEDLESTNGTFVNQRRVANHSLQSGDVILVGKHELVFDRTGGEPVASDDAKLHMSKLDNTVFLDTEQHKALLAKLNGGQSPQEKAAGILAAATVTAAPAAPDKMGVLRVLSGGADQS